MTQESFRFGRLHLVDDAARAAYRGLNDAVDALGMVVAAGACGIDRSDLRRGLDRDGRRLGLEHAMAIAAVAADGNYELATRIGSAIVRPLGLDVGVHEPLTDKERADRLEAAMRAMPYGEQIVSNVLGPGRRAGPRRSHRITSP